MILGLKRGTVSLVDHQAGWEDVFLQERDRFAPLLGQIALRFEHVGSTAVKGLVAKPIIDVAVGVASLAQTDGWPAQLAAVGYEFFGDRENWNEHFYAKGPDDCRTVYLHVVPLDSNRWSNYLRFRDLLRSDSHLRDSYARTKLIAFAAHAADRNSYTAAKERIIREILG